MRSRKRRQPTKRTDRPKEITSQKLAQLIAKGAVDKKAEDIEIIDVRKSSSVCNYFVICSSSSKAQTGAIAGGIDEVLEKNSVRVPRWQGRPDSNWMILDMISVIAHVMGTEERSRYKLEDLWGKSGIIYHV
ncbi:MAG: ribosome silencing factor [Candidatus Saganbacteria bacterium]|nr:ribosome silencing factor [Candidatus Saganbacteria bacterium]